MTIIKTYEDVVNNLEILNKQNQGKYDTKVTRKINVLTSVRERLDMLPKRYRKYTFETLEETPGNKEAIEAVKHIDIENGEFILLHGNSGNGKTHIAVAGLMNAVLSRGAKKENPNLPAISVAYVELSEYFRLQRARMNGEKVEIPKYALADLLIIDDLGKLKPSDWTYQEMFNLIERRWANEKATIMTTNFSLEELALKLSPSETPDLALLSRITSGKVFEIKGRDRRKD